MKRWEYIVGLLAAVLFGYLIYRDRQKYLERLREQALAQYVEQKEITIPTIPGIPTVSLPGNSPKGPMYQEQGAVVPVVPTVSIPPRA